MRIFLVAVLFIIGCGDDVDKNSDLGSAVQDKGVASLDSDVDGSASGLKWYKTCGDPVCSLKNDAGASGCAANQIEGAACSTKDDSCKMANACGAQLICADKPFDLNNCPISHRRYKKEIGYLNSTERNKILDDVLKLRLARYKMKAAPQRGERLGFIIEDGPPAYAMRKDEGVVDLYGYTSLVVAAVQAQQEQIKILQKQLKKLTRENAALAKKVSSSAH